MPDEPFARLEERLAAIAHRLDRAETTCERRSNLHVDRSLYDSERKAMRDEIAGYGSRMTDHERRATQEFADLRVQIQTVRREATDTVNDLANKIQRDRQWAIGVVATVVLTLLGYVVAVLT